MRLKFPNKTHFLKNHWEAMNIKYFSIHIFLTPVKNAQSRSSRLKVAHVQLKQ